MMETACTDWVLKVHCWVSDLCRCLLYVVNGNSSSYKGQHGSSGDSPQWDRKKRDLISRENGFPEKKSWLLMAACAQNKEPSQQQSRQRQRKWKANRKQVGRIQQIALLMKLVSNRVILELVPLYGEYSLVSSSNGKFSNTVMHWYERFM